MSVLLFCSIFSSFLEGKVESDLIQEVSAEDLRHSKGGEESWHLVSINSLTERNNFLLRESMGETPVDFYLSMIRVMHFKIIYKGVNSDFGRIL